MQVSLSAELARTYFELRGAQERLEVARRNGENQRRTLEVTQQRLDAGRGTAFDTERARTQLGFTLASIPRSRGAGGVGAVPDRRAGGPAAGAGWPRSWLQLRRDPRAARRGCGREPGFAHPPAPGRLGRRAPGGGRARVRRRGEGGLSAARHGGRERRLLPRPSSAASGTMVRCATPWDRSSPGRRSTWAGSRPGWTPARRGRRRPRRSTHRRCCARCRRWRRGCRGIGRRAGRVERIGDAAAASARAADLARLRFEGGVADFLQVLDAERTQLDAEDQLAQAHTDAATSYAALFKALGGTPLERDAGTR